MRNGAYVEILGRLGSDIQIRSTKEGKSYGVLSIAVNKKVKVTSEDNKLINNTKWFKAIIWNEHLLIETAPLLKAGKKILLIGELDVVQTTAPKSKGNNIIVVRSKTGIAVIAETTWAETEEISHVDEQESIIPEEILL